MEEEKIIRHGQYISIPRKKCDSLDTHEIVNLKTKHVSASRLPSSVAY